MRHSCGRGGCYPYHSDGRAARSLRACPPQEREAVSVARPALSGHEAMRTARTTRHGENDETSWTKRRGGKMGGKPFGTSDKTGRDEERDGRRDGTSQRDGRRDARRDEGRDGIDEANEATGNGAEDLTGRGTRQAGRCDR